MISNWGISWKNEWSESRDYEYIAHDLKWEFTHIVEFWGFSDEKQFKKCWGVSNFSIFHAGKILVVWYF